MITNPKILIKNETSNIYSTNDFGSYLRGLNTSEIRRATRHKSESAFEKYIFYLMIKRGGSFLPLILTELL